MPLDFFKKLYVKFAANAGFAAIGCLGLGFWSWAYARYPSVDSAVFFVAGTFLFFLIAPWIRTWALPWHWADFDRARHAKSFVACLLFFSVYLGSLAVFFDPGWGLKFMAPGLCCLALWAMAGGVKPEGPSAVMPWEGAFIWGLCLLAVGLYVFRLNDLPPGAHGHEGIMVNVIWDLSQGPYLAHSGNNNASWPSLVFYQALACAKLFGSSPASLRLPSAAWGVLAVLAFYFLCRKLCSPLTAAIAAILFCVDATMLQWSRALFPGTVLLFAELVAMYALLDAREEQAGTSMLMAGAAVGLALHGYVPGRVLAPCVVAWMLASPWLTPKRVFLLKDWRNFWIAFLLTILPLLLWYVRGGAPQYWGYVESVNPSQNLGLAAYFNNFFQVLPDYLKMFNLVGDPGGVVPKIPWLPPLVGGFFLLGLGLSLFKIRTRQSSLLLLIFCAVLVPAVLGGSFPHPTNRRAIMALPLCYLFFGIGLQRAWSFLAAGLHPWAKKGILVGGALLLLMQAGYSLHNYFVVLPHNLDSLIILDHTGFLARQDLEKLPRPRRVYFMESFTVDAMPMTFAGESSTVIQEPEDIVRIENSGNALFVLDGIYGPAMDFIQNALPGALVRRQPDIYKYRIGDWHSDGYAQSSLFWSVALKQGCLDKVGRLKFSAPGQPESELSVGKDLIWQGTPGAFRLSGTIVAPDWGGPVVLHNLLPGGKLYLNGGLLPESKPIIFSGGVNDLVYEGVAGAKATLPFPFRLQSQDVDTKLCYLPSAWKHGIDLAISDTEFPPPNTRYFRRPCGAYRFGLGPWKNSWKIYAETVVKAPRDGIYEFGSGVKCGLDIWVDGREVFDNWVGRQNLSRPVRAKKGQMLHLKMDYRGLQDMEDSRAFQLLWKTPNAREFEAVPSKDLWL